MKEKTRFDLEQEMMNCWHIVDDLQVLLDEWDTIDDNERLNIIIGAISLYKLKFDSMFRTFETCIRNKEFKPSSYEEALNKEYADDLARTYGLKGNDCIQNC